MAKIIFKDKDGKQTEAVSKQEFDGRVNTTNALYSSKDAPYDLHDVLSSEYGDNTWQEDLVLKSDYDKLWEVA